MVAFAAMTKRPKRLLLISTSTTHGTGYLDHCADQIQDLLGGLERVLFVPYALRDHDGYTAKARERYSRMGYELTSVHETDDPVAAVRATDALFIGGGNTFRLLARLYEKDPLEPTRAPVPAGAACAGAAAGAAAARG